MMSASVAHLLLLGVPEVVDRVVLPPALQVLHDDVITHTHISNTSRRARVRPRLPGGCAGALDVMLSPALTMYRTAAPSTPPSLLLTLFMSAVAFWMCVSRLYLSTTTCGFWLMSCSTTSSSRIIEQPGKEAVGESRSQPIISTALANVPLTSSNRGMCMSNRHVC